MKIVWLAACAALLAGCEPAPTAPIFLGYAEADTVRIAAPQAGRLVALRVQRGDAVARGAPLFALEDEESRAAREEAQARVERADAQWRNLQTGRRPAELDVVQAQLRQAEAARALSAQELGRQETLLARGFVAAAAVDTARTGLQRDQARVRELQAQLASARLPARGGEIAAAQAELQAARQALAQVEWRLGQRAQSAPVAGQVEDSFYRVGEYVAAGAPVLALLPPENLKLRFYVPQGQLAQLKLGDAVRIDCDGCTAPIAARVSFIAAQAEYTPPVIYSRQTRDKLVFLVEARPAAADAARLRPGLPVEARLTASGSGSTAAGGAAR
jgi:HlyD family secretion protein